MTSESLRSQLERDPFIPLRLHLVSGKTIDIGYPGISWLLQNSLIVMHPVSRGSVAVGGYDEMALRLIERIEQRPELAQAG